jgi:hypothetical protein
LTDLIAAQVQYMLTADMARGMMSKNLKKNKEFIVEAEVPLDFVLDSDTRLTRCCVCSAMPS